jgi:signal transduction histidine kinase
VTDSSATTAIVSSSPSPHAGRRSVVVLTIACVTAAMLQAVLPFVAWSDGPVDALMVVAVTLSTSSFAFLGLYAFVKRPSNRVGPLMMAVAFAAWIGLIGWISTSVTYTLGFLFQDLWLAVLGQLFLAFPTGRLESRLDRSLVIITYAWWFVSTMVLLAFLDFRANGGIFENALLIHADDDLANTIARAGTVITAALALCFLYALVRHWRLASPAGRRVLAPVLWASIPSAAVIVSRVGGDALNVDPVNEIVRGPIGVLALTTLPVGFAVGLLRSRLGRALVSDLVVELGEGPAPGRARETLARVLHDPSLRIAYRLPGSEAFVDEDGRPVGVLDEPGQSLTPIERGGESIAVLVHDPAVHQDPDLLRSAVAAARLAVENERLRAEVRAQLEEVEASRARIVEAGDVERRRVERNLHDGAQQRLVTLSLELRWLRDHLPDDADDELTSSIDRLAAELRTAIDELRELARGIHPAILTEEGLVAAVGSLADRSVVPITVEADEVGRLAEPIEATAYFVIAEGLANVAKYASFSHADVRIRRNESVLEVEVADDGDGGADIERGSGLRGLDDRVAAIGGRLTVASPIGHGTVVRAEVPLDGR